MFARTLVALTLFLNAGCQATAGAQVQTNSAGQVDASSDLSLSRNSSASNSRSPTSATDNLDSGEATAQVQQAMLGARAGLRLGKSGEATCQCLRVVVGNATDARFTWEGPAPKTNPETQLVVGLSSEGLPCPNAATDSLGASYHGYEVAGNDVVVQVETARLGRPIAQGAVVPKPPSGGRILVQAVDTKSPYGRSPDGKSSSCLVWSAP